jgi:excisionase family DNA binding protein
MLLTEADVAARLHCSREKVKRLRLSGKLAYLKGRPVLVKEEDLDAYVESIRCPNQCHTLNEPQTAPGTSTGPNVELENVLARARKMRLRRVFSLRTTC